MSGAGVQGSLEEIEQRRQHNLVDVILTDERTNVYRLIPDSPAQECSHFHPSKGCDATSASKAKTSESDVDYCHRRDCQHSLITEINKDSANQSHSVCSEFVHNLSEGCLYRKEKVMSSSEGDQVISSASAIMSRHQRKKKKWYKRLGSKVKSAMNPMLSSGDRNISKSAENLCVASGLATMIGGIGGARSMIDLHRGTDSNHPPPSLMMYDSDDSWADTESNASADLISTDSGILMCRRKRTVDDDDNVTEHDSVSQILDANGNSGIPSQSLLGFSLSRIYEQFSMDGSEESDASSIISVDSEHGSSYSTGVRIRRTVVSGGYLP